MTPLDWLDAKEAAGAAGSPVGKADEAEALLEGLNEPQRAAVTNPDGGLLILAGAGSGKTRVITRRVAWLVATGRAQPGEILAITFTNKAAREMRERVGESLPIAGMWISTFHAMCARILRRDVETLGGGWSRSFTIYDTADKNQLLKTITKELGYDTQRFRPAMLSGWISDHKNGRDGSDEEEVYAGGSVEDEVFQKVYARYERAMADNNAFDFDDLQLKVLQLFDQHPGVRDSYAHRFRYVLVDEYQDTNRVQYLLTRHLASWHKNLAVCGDPDQSIYAWRGADIRNILDFEEDFGGAGRAVQVVKLEQNYRSIPAVLKAAQGLIRHNAGRKEKDLWTEREDVRKVRVIECGNENDEASCIADEIHRLRGEGVRLDEIAVLFRVNFMQRALERALRMAAVPYQIVGGVEFYTRREIRDLIAYLQLFVNPADEVACRRVLNVPARGVGEKSVEKLLGWARTHGSSLLQAAGREEARAEIRGRARKGLAAFAQLFERFEGLADRPAAEAIQRVIDETDYLAWLRMDDASAEDREDNVHELLSHAETYDREEPEGFLRGFLQEVALVSDVDGWDEDTERVTLMTLHASKGLEFPAVVVAGLEEELLPHARALMDDGPEAGVEEERRLLYVGMTRAQDHLLLTHAQTRMYFGETSWRQPSRFLKEIPSEFLEGAAAEAPSEDEVLGEWEETAATSALKEGARVMHDHFGYGHVVRLQGSGVNARVTVEFQGVGAKVLLVQYANLEIVG